MKTVYGKMIPKDDRYEEAYVRCPFCGETIQRPIGRLEHDKKGGVLINCVPDSKSKWDKHGWMENDEGGHNYYKRAGCDYFLFREISSPLEKLSYRLKNEI